MFSRDDDDDYNDAVFHVNKGIRIMMTSMVCNLHSQITNYSDKQLSTIC